MNGIGPLLLPVAVAVALYRRVRWPWYGFVAVLSLAALWVGWLWLVAMALAVIGPRYDRSWAVPRGTTITLSIVGVVALTVGLFAAVPARAHTGHYGWHYRQAVYEAHSDIWPHPLEMKQTLGAHWETASAGDCHSLYPCIRTLIWDKDYENGLWHFDHWLTARDATGTCNTRYTGCVYRQRTQAAQWYFCFVAKGVPACDYGIVTTRVRVYADGSSMVWTFDDGFPWS
jgi:hypothetical protein